MFIFFPVFRAVTQATWLCCFGLIIFWKNWSCQKNRVAFTICKSHEYVCKDKQNTEAALKTLAAYCVAETGLHTSNSRVSSSMKGMCWLCIERGRVNFKLLNQHFPLRGLVLLARWLWLRCVLERVDEQGLVCCGRSWESRLVGKAIFLQFHLGALEWCYLKWRTNRAFMEWHFYCWKNQRCDQTYIFLNFCIHCVLWNFAKRCTPQFEGKDRCCSLCRG